jgi:C1A family cysteine protease
LLISLFRSRPNLAIGLVVVGVAGFFLITRTNSPMSEVVTSLMFGTGLEMDQRIYDEAEVYEPLADNVKNPLPESVSLAAYCPPRLNQGKQGSCVGWASAYAARTIMHARASGQDPSNVTFSPSYVYNQIALPNCQGTYLQRAMEVMHKGGALPFSRFGYNENSCSKKPSRMEMSAAANYKTKGFNRLTHGGDDYSTDLLAIKQNLAQGAPVVIGMMVGGNFMQNMMGRRLYTPNRSDYSGARLGGHAMCVVGYDDYYEGGAFQIMNSWGEEWGEDGMFWMRYNDFDYFTREAYGLYPMGNADAVVSDILEVEMGLIMNANGRLAPLTSDS